MMKLINSADMSLSSAPNYPSCHQFSHVPQVTSGDIKHIQHKTNEGLLLIDIPCQADINVTES